MIFSKEIDLTILGSILGAIASIGIALVFQYRQRQQQYEQIIDRFKFNIDRMNDIVTRLTTTTTAKEFPTFLLDTTILDMLFASGPDLFQSSYHTSKHAQDLFIQLNWCRYQMHHINNKLTMIPFLRGGLVHQSDIDDLVNHARGESANIKKILEIA